MITSTNDFGKRPALGVRGIVIAVAVCGLILPHGRSAAAEKGNDPQAVLQVPETDSEPRIDGKLEEQCWRHAARTGPLTAVQGKPAGSRTQVLILRSAKQLYVGVNCEKVLTASEGTETDKKSTKAEYVELLIDSNRDRNSYYLIRIEREQGGQTVTSYNEHDPPWRDRTWQPRLESAVAVGENLWTAEVALPLRIFNKNRELTSEIGFNVSRDGMSGSEVHCWQHGFPDPGTAGILAGIPQLENLPRPVYGTRGLNRWYHPPSESQRSFLAKQKGQTIELGAGSAHPGTTGEVALELDGFLLAGDPHARGIVWDLAVNAERGELYVLSDTRQVRGVPKVRVFDRQGRYLRTIMPFNPNLPRASVRDLCRTTAREAGTELVIPKLFNTWGDACLYGDHWHLPQKLTLAPNGDLIMSNIARGTLWRMKPDGSLPREGWTSIYHPDRNEPFESTTWTQDWWHIADLKNYLPFHSLHYPYFCFGPDGSMYVSAGQSSKPTRLLGYYWEIGQQQQNHYHWDIPGQKQRDRFVWKCKMLPGVKYKKRGFFGGFDEPSGLAFHKSQLIVADTANDRLQVLDENGRSIASITHYEYEGEKHPLNGPTALAMDRDHNLYVLVAQHPRPKNQGVERSLASLRHAVVAAAAKPAAGFKRVVKLKSWRHPEATAVSKPLPPDVLQLVVDSGVSPALVWIANGAGPGSLLQLSGGDLSAQAKWEDDGSTLSYPRQSGSQPILNIDPQTGHLYVEDDSNYRLKQYGTVYRLDQHGKVLKKWPPLFFDAKRLKMTSPWFTLDYDRHFRYPDEPLFIDSIFGQDGRIYRWKLGKTGIEILRFDRDGKPVPFKATGTNALFVDHPMQANFWHDVYHGMDIDRHGTIYYVAKVDAEPNSHPVSPYERLHRQINVYNVDGELQQRALLRLDCVQGIQLDQEGCLYIVHRPAKRPWDDYLAISKFSPSGQELWSRRWEGYKGIAEVRGNPPCHCTTFRHHQALDDHGYLYAAGQHSVQIIDCQTGKLVGEFGSYGNMDCQGKGSRFPHPELPFGTISSLAVWKDRLFVVDGLNRRIVTCRIVYGKPE